MNNISIKKAFASVSATPDKWMTILLLSVCILIPYVGPIVIAGYCVKRNTLALRGLPLVDFDFNDFTHYLKNGIWLFLVSLVLSLILSAIYMIAFIPLLFIALAPENIPMMIILIVCTCILFALLSFLSCLFSYPMMHRAALTQSFSEAFKMSWVMSFIMKTWMEILWGSFLLYLIFIPLSIIGLLCLYIGIIPVTAVFYIVSYHLQFQLYQLFLERGGEPIEICSSILTAKAPITAVTQKPTDSELSS